MFTVNKTFMSETDHSYKSCETRCDKDISKTGLLHIPVQIRRLWFDLVISLHIASANFSKMNH